MDVPVRFRQIYAPGYAPRVGVWPDLAASRTVPHRHVTSPQLVLPCCPFGQLSKLGAGNCEIVWRTLGRQGLARLAQDVGVKWPKNVA